MSVELQKVEFQKIRHLEYFERLQYCVTNYIETVVIISRQLEQKVSYSKVFLKNPRIIS